MRTKFINIPKDQRQAIRIRARESLLHWKANHTTDVKRFIKSKDANGEFYLYRLHGGTVYLYFETKDGVPAYTGFVWKDEFGSEVHFDVSRQHWCRKLFFDLMREKQQVTAN